MTKDFRHVGRLPTAPPPASAAPAAPTAAGQRLILLALQADVAAFLAAGLWLLAGGASPFPPHLTPLIGNFCLVAGVFGLIPIALLRRRWRRPARPDA